MKTIASCAALAALLVVAAVPAEGGSPALWPDAQLARTAESWRARALAAL